MNLARRTTTTSLHIRPALLLKRKMQSSLQINRDANTQLALGTTLLQSLFRIDRLTNHLQVALSFQGQAPPVTSKTIGSYPTFMASHRFPQSFKSNLRLVYEFAAESSTLAEVAKFVARNGDTIAKSNANRGNCRQEDATIEGVVIIKISAGRSCGSDGNNPIDSKLGRAPANSAYRYIVLRNVLCINYLCPDAIHARQWRPGSSHACGHIAHPPPSRMGIPNHKRTASRNTYLGSHATIHPPMELCIIFSSMIRICLTLYFRAILNEFLLKILDIVLIISKSLNDNGLCTWAS